MNCKLCSLRWIKSQALQYLYEEFMEKRLFVFQFCHCEIDFVNETVEIMLFLEVFMQ